MQKLLLLLLLALSLAHPVSALADNVLRRGNGAEPETLDIHKSSGVPEATIQRDLFEGLVTEAADGSLQPGVAEKWDIAQDGLHYTFHLREDARWSEGSPVTAQDFVFAWHRALNPATASDYAFILWPVAGAESYNKGETTDPSTVGVKASDAHTLDVTLKAPTPYFLNLLLHHMAYPLPQARLENSPGDWLQPGKMTSNGAYRLAEWQPQSHIRLEKNPHYRHAKDIRIDSVLYIPTEDKNTELKRFRAGELDITEDIPNDQTAWVRENLPDSLHSAPYIGTYYYAFNLADPAFKDNPKLRRALALALDRDILTQKITQSGEIPAYGWVPAVDGHTQQTLEEKTLDKNARETLARQLYADSGYGPDKPLQLEILYNTSDNHKKLAVAVAAMWKQVLGVNTTLRNEEWKVYLDSRSQKQFQVVRSGWIGDYNDAYSFLSLFKSDVGEMNTAGYRNPEFDRLLHEAETNSDARMRREALEQAERVLLSDMPIVPVYFYTTQHLLSPRLNGWEDNVMDIHPTRYLSWKP